MQLCIYFQANAWAQSKQLPGQFTGTTDVRILSQQELAGPDKRNQAWAKKVGVVCAAVLTAGSLPLPVCLASGTAGQLVITLVGSIFPDLTQRSRLKELEDMGDAHSICLSSRFLTFKTCTPQMECSVSACSGWTGVEWLLSVEMVAVAEFTDGLNMMATLWPPAESSHHFQARRVLPGCRQPVKRVSGFRFLVGSTVNWHH